MTTKRDEDLGRLLESIDEAPAAQPGFDDRLWTRIEGESPVAVTGRPRPALLSRRRLAVAGVALAAAVAAVLAFGLPSSHRLPGGPTPAEAMVAKLDAALWGARSLQADFTETLRVTPSPDRPLTFASWRGTLAATASGNYRWTMSLDRTSPGVRFEESLGQSDVARRKAIAIRKRGGIVLESPAREVGVFDASTFTARWARWDASGRVIGSGAEVRWPVPVMYGQNGDPLAFLVQYIRTAALIRAAVAGNASLPVRVVSYDGRPAWEVTIDLPLAESTAISQGTITVDQATGVMVHSTYRCVPSGASARQEHPYAVDLSFTDVRLNDPLPTPIFTTLPATVPTPSATPTPSLIDIKDSGGRIMVGGSIDKASVAAGFVPLVPQRLPNGFTFSTAASGLGVSEATAPMLGVPWRREVDVLYRSGFDWLEVDVVKEGADVGDMRDMFASGSRQIGMAPTVIETGALQGETAWSWGPEVSWPTPVAFCATQPLLPLYVSGGVTVFGRHYGVFVRGSLTTQRLLDIVKSLEIYRR